MLPQKGVRSASYTHPLGMTGDIPHALLRIDLNLCLLAPGSLRTPKLLWGLYSRAFSQQPCCAFESCESAMIQQSNILPQFIFSEQERGVCVSVKNNRKPMPKFHVVSHLYKYMRGEGILKCGFISHYPGLI